MIQAFSNALRTIYNTIPSEILEVAFTPSQFNCTLDERIQDRIIRGRVLHDCNINAGQIKRIPLYACETVYLNPDPMYTSLTDPSNGALYKIPPGVREHRDIVGVIDISYPYDYVGMNDAQMGFGVNGNDLMGLASFALRSRTHTGACLTPTPTLLANNMVLINPTNSFMSDWVLLCRLAYDENFTSINNSSITPLTNLIVTATKAYIWVNLTIKIDQAVLSGGQEIGKFKEIVDQYTDANNQYSEDLIKFRGSTLYDPKLMPFLVRSSL